MCKLIEKKLGLSIDLKTFFRNSTAELLANEIGQFEKCENNKFIHADEKERYMMSPSQRRVYTVCAMDNTRIVYNMPMYVAMKGKLDFERLDKAINTLVARHEILRTCFEIRNGQFYQKILSEVVIKCEMEKNDCIKSVSDMVANFVKPFDLEHLPLVRIKVIETAEITYLLFDMHHIISDGVSMNLFISEFCSLYNGKELEPVEYQYKDYTEWSLKRDLNEQKDYWMQYYRNLPEPLNFPLDNKRTATRSYEGDEVIFTIDYNQKEKICEFTQVYNFTEYMFFIASLMITLSKYSGQEEIVIGSPVSGRVRVELETIMGMFVNTLAIKGNVQQDKSVLCFLNEVKTDCVNALQNQEYPFEKLVEELEIRHDSSRNPLFDVMLVFQNNDMQEVALNGIEILGVKEIGAMAKADITVVVIPTKDEYILKIEYSKELFNKETIHFFGTHLLHAMSEIVSSPQKLLKDVSLIDSVEEKKLLDEFNATANYYDEDATIQQLFEQTAFKYPNNIAISCGDMQYTYGDLNHRANYVAHVLMKQGIKKGDFVAIVGERSAEMIIGLLGVLKAGAAYIPIDCDYPIERIEYMINDSKPKLILTASNFVYNGSCQVISLQTDLPYDVIYENMESQSEAHDLAYCIYTSGTTGVPKGVLIEHYGVANLREYFIQKQEVTEDDRVLQFASIAFDAMVSEIAMSILIGGTLCIIDEGARKDIEGFEQFLHKNKISIAILPPTFLNIVQINGLRTVISAGSACTKALVEKNKDICVYSNDYGPTEITVCATYWKHNAFDLVPDRIPIGRPINNKHVYIFNGDSLCGIGMPGELCVSGVGLARGYLNQEELTKAKFTINPVNGERMYRTGDLARWQEDGNIEFLGRIDDQVKIRGYRVELGE